MSAFIIAGAYEGHLIGYRLPEELADATEELDAPLPPSFAFKAHDGSVKALAAGGPHLSTCGADHTICVYNLRKMRGQERLLQQEGGAMLRCLAFFSDSHLLSGGNDGELCIWRSKDWECLLRMKGHKGAVHSIAVHPTGRVALSVAADKKLMLWNLTTAKCNYTVALAEPAWLIGWSADGELYAHDTRNAVLVYALRTSALKFSLPHPTSPPLSFAFLSDGLIATGDHAGTLRLWSLQTGEVVCQRDMAHQSRVKSIQTFAGKPGLIATASTDGTICVWRWVEEEGGVAASKKKKKQQQQQGGVSLQRLLSLSTRLRLTSLCVSDLSVAPTAAAVAVSSGPAPPEEEGSEEEEEEGEEEEEDSEEGSEEEEDEDEEEEEVHGDQEVYR